MAAEDHVTRTTLGAAKRKMPERAAY